MSSCQSSEQWGWSEHTESWAAAGMWLKDKLQDPWWVLVEGGTQPAQTCLGFAAWQMEKDGGW